MDRLVTSFIEMVKIDSESGDEAAFLSYLSDRFAREGNRREHDGTAMRVARRTSEGRVRRVDVRQPQGVAR